MSKKIKSVKLKKDYYNGFDILIPQGTIQTAITNNSNIYYFKPLDFYVYPPSFTEQYIEDHPDFFEIEYEPEVKSIIVKIEYEEREYNKYTMNDYYVKHALNDFHDGRDFKSLKVTELSNE